LLFNGNQTSPWNIAVVLSRKAFSPYKYAASPWKHASSPWKHRSFDSVETRSIYVKHDTLARMGHLFSAETCSFSVQGHLFSAETCSFSVQTCSFSVETRAFSVEYLLVLYDGGEEEKIKSQRNLVARGLKGTL
jgi:hypothetical protein